MNNTITPNCLVQLADDITLVFSEITLENLDLVSKTQPNRCVQYFNELNQATNKKREEKLKKYSQL